MLVRVPSLPEGLWEPREDSRKFSPLSLGGSVAALHSQMSWVLKFGK